MTVRELIDQLEEFDDDMEVIIGMKQRYGSNFAMEISESIEEHGVNSFYEDDIIAVVLTECGQVGVVDYDEVEIEEK